MVGKCYDPVGLLPPYRPGINDRFAQIFHIETPSNNIFNKNQNVDILVS